MTKIERVWVDPDFKKKLKQQATANDKSILEFTKELAKMGDPLDAFKKKRTGKFGFKFP